MALTRSEVMSRIRGADTKPEVALRAALEDRSIRHDLLTKPPAGRPDIVSAGTKLAVFVDGCFWHGCPSHYVRPRTREEFWAAKLIMNLERDARTSIALTEAGWTVIRIWEHEVIEELRQAADHVEKIALGTQPPDWPSQRRVRRILETADNFERREFVLLGDPTIVIGASEGRRVTTKARPKRMSNPHG